MSMEPETRAFLIRIVNTLSFTLIWMMLNLTIGIYFGLAFFKGSPDWKNISYYLFFLLSLAGLLLYLRKKWRL
jgi:hypothetical protein